MNRNRRLYQSQLRISIYVFLLTIALVCWSDTAVATTQEREVLRYGEQEYAIRQFPLQDIVDRSDVSLDVTSTGLNRGYLGTWDLHDGALYLAGLKATSAGKSVNVHAIAPCKKLPCKAIWYTGGIAIPLGSYSESGVAEILVVFWIEKGNVVQVELKRDAKEEPHMQRN
jgi:hypothetical protein